MIKSNTCLLFFAIAGFALTICRAVQFEVPTVTVCANSIVVLPVYAIAPLVIVGGGVSEHDPMRYTYAQELQKTIGERLHDLSRTEPETEEWYEFLRTHKRGYDIVWVEQQEQPNGKPGYYFHIVDNCCSYEPNRDSPDFTCDGMNLHQCRFAAYSRFATIVDAHDNQFHKRGK